MKLKEVLKQFFLAAYIPFAFWYIDREKDLSPLEKVIAKVFVLKLLLT